ncbi:hypothetical protein J2S55_006300 [Streptosporangium brasiliense]|uniref:Uncharacterized protein n=1 Tax=Streptosporangium brasiliense TaxID=47480 RepID=A0ABT9RE74_9ACTN|nr:hypothetical protein [Streptosporangium brasiliense]
MGEDKHGFDDVADFAGAGSDALEGAPALGEQGETSFSQTAQGAQECVTGAGGDVEGLAVSRLFDRGENTDADAVVAGIGQCGEPVGGGSVQRSQDVFAGCDQVVDRPGFDVGYPERQAVRYRQRLDVAAVVAGLSGVPQVNRFAFDAGGLSQQWSVAMRVPSRIRWVRPASAASCNSWCRSGAWLARTSMTSSM